MPDITKGKLPTPQQVVTITPINDARKLTIGQLLDVEQIRKLQQVDDLMLRAIRALWHEELLQAFTEFETRPTGELWERLTKAMNGYQHAKLNLSSRA